MSLNSASFSSPSPRDQTVGTHGLCHCRVTVPYKLGTEKLGILAQVNQLVGGRVKILKGNHHYFLRMTRTDLNLHPHGRPAHSRMSSLGPAGSQSPKVQPWPLLLRNLPWGFRACVRTSEHIRGNYQDCHQQPRGTPIPKRSSEH